jgi:hypothetical protein
LEGSDFKFGRFATLWVRKKVDPINKLKSSIPFKIGFDVEVISQAEARKGGALLHQSLLGLDPDLFNMKEEVMVFSVYGRRRALPPLIGKGINSRMIDQIAHFATGACSCQIKNQNPGTDLLIGQDWDKAVFGKSK